jgi:hypothetical protein
MAIQGRTLLDESVAVESFVTEITYKAARYGILSMGPLTGDPNTDETVVVGGLLLDRGNGVRRARMVGTHGDELQEATVEGVTNGASSAYVISSCNVGASGRDGTGI